MRKALVMLAVFMVALALPIFADDALVLPVGVLRTYITGAYGFGDKNYDADGKSQDGYVAGAVDSKLTAINLGAAVEFGLTDWISPGVQWAPGYNVSSKIDGTGAPFDLNANGSYDLKVGAKFQIVGPKSPVQSEKIRFALTPGVKIPIGGVDWEKQVENMAAGDAVTYMDPAKHAWAFGAQASADYVINEKFFVNLFMEYMKYLERKDAASSFPEYMGLGETFSYDYGYSLTIEAEPHFGTKLGAGNFSAGLPLTYETWPDTKVNGTSSDNKGYSFSVSPSVSYFFLLGPLPFEAKLGYTLPLAGENTSATNTIVFQFKSYLKF